jgi:hypothetical protein
MWHVRCRVRNAHIPWTDKLCEACGARDVPGRGRLLTDSLPHCSDDMHNALCVLACSLCRHQSNVLVFVAGYNDIEEVSVAFEMRKV